MKGFIYCFSCYHKNLEDTLENSALQKAHTPILVLKSPIYKIDTTILSVEDTLITLNKLSDKIWYKYECAVSLEDLDEACVFKKLEGHKFNDDNIYFNINISKIMKLFSEEFMSIKDQRRKIEHIKKFINNTVVKSLESSSSLEDSSEEVLRSSDLYSAYKSYVRKRGILPCEKAGICEFVELCQKHTFLGVGNMYYEWTHVKLKK